MKTIREYFKETNKNKVNFAYSLAYSWYKAGFNACRKAMAEEVAEESKKFMQGFAYGKEPLKYPKDLKAFIK